MRPIDADKLRDWVRAEANPYGMPKIDYDSGLKVLDMIDRMPTIEPTIDWKPFRQREMTEEEREEFPANIAAMWDEPTPDDEQIILITDGTIAWTDKFLIDDDGGCYLGSGVDIEEGMAWVPCPELYKPKEEGSNAVDE